MKKPMKLMSLILLSLSSLSAQAAPGPAPAVELLGQTVLARTPDTDGIQVRGFCPGPQNRPVRAIQLRVLRRAADVDAVALQYGNGAWDRIHVRERFARGSVSRIIDLPGGARCVDKIALLGESEGLPGGKAVVQVFGIR